MSDTQAHTAEPLAEPLTRREREILGLLDDGLSAPEIAQRLTLAVSSVKWHIGQLYGKLGVGRRQQALIRARALGLLGMPAPDNSTPQHNLPMALTRFFGREPEIPEIQGLLAEYRLVTLTGAGGVGKTRLALRVAEEALPDFAGGAWLVALAALADPGLVPQSVAAALGVRDDPGRPLVETLIRYLRGRQVLLLLDNCEHLLAACAPLAEQLLSACSRLTLLATSREPMGVAGEAVFPTPSLAFPDPDQALTPEQISAFPAVDLLLDRARMVQPHYRITAGNAGWLGRICARLDGVPLAIEMAAARMNVLTAEQLAHRLDDAFGALAGGRRTALPRQQTLRATLDWSYALLTEEERLLLQRLSVFAGGCTLEAAEAVCAGEGLATSRVLDTLAALVAKSMVLAERRQGEETRYRLLEMVRQYGQEKLAAAGEAERLRRRHRDYFRPRWITEPPVPNPKLRYEWYPDLTPDLDNLRLAFEWSLNDSSDVDAAPALSWAIDRNWPSHQEYLNWCMRVADYCETHAGIEPSLHALVLSIGAKAWGLNSPAVAVRLGYQALALSRRNGADDKRTLMWCLHFLGEQILEALRDVEQAAPLILEAESLYHDVWPDETSPAPDRPNWLNAQRMYLQARIAELRREYCPAIALGLASIELYEAIQDVGAIRPRICVGEAYLGLGEFDQARAHFLAAMHMWDNPANYIEKQSRAWALRWVGMADFRAGHLSEARDYCHDSLRLAAEVPDRNIIASGLGLVALIAASQDQPLRAAALAGAASALWQKQGRRPWDDCSLEACLPGWPARPDQPALAAAFEHGQMMDAEEAVAYALGEAAV